MFAIEIDPNTGLWQRDIPNHPENQIGPGFPQYLTTPAPSGLYTPRWDGSQWTEGANDGDIIPAVRQEVIADIKSAGLWRINQRYPDALQNIGLFTLLYDMMTSVLPAALSLKPGISYCNQVFVAARDAVIAVNALTTLTELQAYDPETDPNWPPE